ncbi:MAG: hypothetical protein H6581_25555 [Bacteroidia bacterium]|nr:hypothetical protein [Bacteroidia bacterium]
MLPFKKARQLAIEKIKELSANSGIDFLIMDEYTAEFGYGRIFSYQSAEFVNTKRLGALVGGNAPIIVDKEKGTLHVTGTRMPMEFYLEKYLELRDDPEKFEAEIR